jgi:hypothetical protein
MLVAIPDINSRANNHQFYEDQILPIIETGLIASHDLLHWTQQYEDHSHD